jgi:anti-anti-sigma factor
VSPVPFEVDSEQLEDGVRVFTVRGELDMSTAPELEEKLEGALAEPASRIVLDLCACEFIDSTGIALFLQVRRQLEDKGGRLVLYGCSDQVLRIFTVAGLTEAGIVFDSREAAFAELAMVD